MAKAAQRKKGHTGLPILALLEARLTHSGRQTFAEQRPRRCAFSVAANRIGEVRYA